MILQALQKYYDRLVDDPNQDVPLPGFSQANISFALIIDAAGQLVDVHDLRVQKGKKRAPRPLETPQAEKRTVGVAANFLWDNTSYVLGVDGKGKPKRASQAHQAFKDLCHAVAGQIDDPGMKAVLAFLGRWRPTPEPELPNADWKDVCDQNLVFRLDGQRGYVHQSRAVKQAWLSHCLKSQDAQIGQCLVSGQTEPLARLHPAIKGVWGAQTSGANLVSFNQDAFTSYGKTQSYNAPVGEAAAFAYTTAINRLLASGSRQRIQIGDASTVFWSEDASPLEEMMGMALGANSDAEDTALTERVGHFLEAARQGLPYDQAPDARNPFYVLGLAPNASRISVRFWHASTVAQMQQRLGEHLRDVQIVKQYENQPDFAPLWLLLKETAAQGETKNIPPQLAGEMTRAIFDGGAYPRSLLAALISRARADKEIGYMRAALIKAHLCRLRRLNDSFANDPQSMEVKVSLDTQSTNPAYRLGRLFAVLEKLQADAIKGANSTIRSRYMSSASSAPQATFPQLLRLAQAHIKKSDWGWKYDERIREILNEVTEFPKTLGMEQQGLFFLGYYHQMVDLFPKKQTEVASQEQDAQQDEEK